jgi:hypothetical protein
MPSLLVKVPAKKPTTAKVEYKAVLARLLAVGSSWPPPPMPFRALNMPGHMKQTNETMTSWTGGEANHGSLKPAMVKRLYFHEAGSSFVLESDNEYSAGELTWCAGGSFSECAMSMPVVMLVRERQGVVSAFGARSGVEACDRRRSARRRGCRRCRQAGYNKDTQCSRSGQSEVVAGYN